MSRRRPNRFAIQSAGRYWLGSGLTDPDLSLAATLALFGAFQLDQPAALNAPQYLTGSVLDVPLTATAGSLPVPTGPGLGVTVQASRLTSPRGVSA